MSWVAVGSSSGQARTPETILCLQPEWPPAKGTQTSDSLGLSGAISAVTHPRAPKVSSHGLGALCHRSTPRRSYSKQRCWRVPGQWLQPLMTRCRPRRFQPPCTREPACNTPRGARLFFNPTNQAPTCFPPPQVGQEGPCIPSEDTLHSPVGMSETKGESQLPKPSTQPTGSASAPPLSQSLPCP